jgi:hypothetical protein
MRVLYSKTYSKLKPRKLLQFEVQLADQCNLNCKSCNHFSPLAPEHYLDTDNYGKDCERLAKLTSGRARTIRLMGGEPLLHPGITDIIGLTRKNFPGGTAVKIITNGILLPNEPPEFWECCRKNSVAIEISHYPIKINNTAIKRLAAQYGISVEYTGTDTKSFWRYPLDPSGSQNPENSFKKCWYSNNCIQLVSGRLYTCVTIAYIKYFNTYFHRNYIVGDDDSIDIYKAQNIGEILKFLCNSPPFCRYCNLNKRIDGIIWGVSQKASSEWE